MKIKVLTVIAILATFLFTGANAQPRKGLRYVDALPVPVYAAPRKNSQVLKLLNAGYRVQLISSDRKTGYSRIYFDRNKAGWVLTRQITRRPPAHHQLRMALAKIKELNKTIEAKGSQQNNAGSANKAAEANNEATKALQASNEEIKKQLATLTVSIGELSNQVEKIKQTRNPENIDANQRELLKKLNQLSKKTKAVATTAAAAGNPFKGDQRLTWILWSSLIIGCAFGLGVLVTRIRWRRDSIFR
jgi:SH3 domain protein